MAMTGRDHAIRAKYQALADKFELLEGFLEWMRVQDIYPATQSEPGNLEYLAEKPNALVQRYLDIAEDQMRHVNQALLKFHRDASAED